MNQKLIIFCSVFFVFSCNSQKTVSNKYEANINNLRLKKDQQFKNAVYSPIPKKIKPNFEGLSYFDIDSQWNKMFKVIPFSHKDSIEFNTSKNKKRWYLKYAKIVFEFNGSNQELVLYSSTDTLKFKHLFLPFKDASNGKTTYGAGRYLDLNLPIKSNIYIDFNMAYNPYCAYNVNYSCPLVPAENQLDISINAGEKSPDFLEH